MWTEMLEDMQANWPQGADPAAVTAEQDAEHAGGTMVEAVLGGAGSLARTFAAQGSTRARAVAVGTYRLSAKLQVLAKTKRDGVDVTAARSPAAGFERGPCTVQDVHVFIGCKADDITKPWMGVFFDSDGMREYPIEVIRRGMPLRGTTVWSPPTHKLLAQWLDAAAATMPRLKSALAEQAEEPATAANLAKDVKRQLVRKRRRSGATAPAAAAASSSGSATLPLQSSGTAAAAGQTAAKSSAAPAPSTRPRKASRQ